MAIMEVDKLLKLKPQPTYLIYPTLPTYEEELEGETDEQTKKADKENKESTSRMSVKSSKKRSVS